MPRERLMSTQITSEDLKSQKSHTATWTIWTMQTNLTSRRCASEILLRSRKYRDNMRSFHYRNCGNSRKTAENYTWLRLFRMELIICILQQWLTESQIPVMFHAIFLQMFSCSGLHWTEFKFPVTEVPFFIGSLSKKIATIIKSVVISSLPLLYVRRFRHFYAQAYGTLNCYVRKQTYKFQQSTSDWLWVSFTKRATCSPHSFRSKYGWLLKSIFPMKRLVPSSSLLDDWEC